MLEPTNQRRARVCYGRMKESVDHHRLLDFGGVEKIPILTNDLAEFSWRCALYVNHNRRGGCS